MKSRHSFVTEEIALVMKNHKQYDFTTILKKIRSIYGIGRRRVCEHTGLTHMQLVYFEGGYFMRVPSSVDILNLCTYYAIDVNIIIAKAVDFIMHGKSKQFNTRSKKKK